jgi:hypothetical protein
VGEREKIQYIISLRERKRERVADASLLGVTDSLKYACVCRRTSANITVKTS